MRRVLPAATAKISADERTAPGAGTLSPGAGKGGKRCTGVGLKPYKNIRFNLAGTRVDKFQISLVASHFAVHRLIAR